ncbi:MAG: ATP synthase F0 subunit B [Candidatus Magnetominusculus sp. LBB02]|nr:ATP synthase F0 subunit B [Candidatus Magnetominusculus sp. LBB02]
MIEFNVLWFGVLVANFLILILVLNTLLFKPVIGLVKERRRMRSELLEEAEALAQKKETALLRLKDEMAGVKEKAIDIYTTIRQEGLVTQHELIKKSHEEAVTKLNNALSEISLEVDKAAASIKGDIEKYSNEIAAKLTHGYVKNN